MLCKAVIFLPSIWRKVLFEPFIIFGEVRVLWDPQLEGVVLRAKLQEADAADTRCSNTQDDNLVGVDGDCVAIATKIL